MMESALLLSHCASLGPRRSPLGWTGKPGYRAQLLSRDPDLRKVSLLLTELWKRPHPCITWQSWLSLCNRLGRSEAILRDTYALPLAIRLVKQKLEFPQESCAGRGKSWNLVPASGGICLLKKGFARFDILLDHLTGETWNWPRPRSEWWAEQHLD